MFFQSFCQFITYNLNSYSMPAYRITASMTDDRGKIIFAEA